MRKASCFKVKENKKKQWLEWCEELETVSKSEAIDSLKSEGVQQEACFSVLIDSSMYIIGFSEGVCKDADMSLEVNKKHKEKKEECLEYISPAEVLYLLKSI